MLSLHACDVCLGAFRERKHFVTYLNNQLILVSGWDSSPDSGNTWFDFDQKRPEIHVTVGEIYKCLYNNKQYTQDKYKITIILILIRRHIWGVQLHRRFGLG